MMFDDYDVDADYYSWALVDSECKDNLETIDEETLLGVVDEHSLSIQQFRYYQEFQEHYNEDEEEQPRFYEKTKPKFYIVQDKIDDRFLNWNRDNAISELKELQQENLFLKLKNGFLQRQCVTHILRVMNDSRKLEHSSANRPLNDPE